MIVERLPGMENEDDKKEALKSLANSIYPERHLGRNKQADLFEKTFDAIYQIKFKS